MASKLSARGAENLFLAVSCMELFMGLLRMCGITMPFSRYVLWLLTLFYAAVAASRRYTVREKAVFVILVAFGILLYVNTGLNKGIRAVFYLYAMKDTDMRRYFKAMLAVLVASTLLFAVLSGWGVMGAFTMTDVRADRGFDGVRYCFGYEHANSTMAVAFWALICILALCHEKQSWLLCAALTGSGYLALYYLTDCRTAFVIGVAVAAGMLCVRLVRWEGWPKLVFAVFALLFVLMLAISLMAAFHVENGWMAGIDHFISGRISQLTKYPCGEEYALPYVENWHLFGGRGNHNDYDLGYVQIFYYYGIVPAVCYLLCIVCAAVKTWKDGDAWKLVLLLGLSIHLFMESMYFSNFVPVDFLLVYAVSLLWGDYGRKEKDDIICPV